MINSSGTLGPEGHHYSEDGRKFHTSPAAGIKDEKNAWEAHNKTAASHVMGGSFIVKSAYGTRYYDESKTYIE